MERVSIDSTAIASIGYDEANLLLEIEYRNGRTYQYLDVPSSCYRDLMASASIGQFVNLQVKPFYRVSAI